MFLVEVLLKIVLSCLTSIYFWCYHFPALLFFWLGRFCYL